ncbi:MAG: putative amidohydrolase [Planctomycetota bacterium]|nr:putative amidohydrolase [Planctomycetota bacterium]
MKLLAAAIQMPSEPGNISENLERADTHLQSANADGVSLAVLPEMFNTGYGLLPDYGPLAEEVDGPTISHLVARSRDWGMAIAAGFVERDGHHLYDSLALCLPNGRVHVYRKRNLVFWERFRFRPGGDSVVANTPFGRIGFAICADMIYRRVWDGYRDRIDLAIISAAWPDFACRESGRKHWLFGHVGPLSGAIPGKVAVDLGVPVIFANQVGQTKTTIPYLGTWITEKITDRFAGKSCLCDGRHSGPILAGTDESVLLSEITIHPPRGPRSWRSTSPSGFVASSSASAHSGLVSPRIGSIAEPIAGAS